MLPPPKPNFILFQLDFNVKFPLLRLLLFLIDLKSKIFTQDNFYAMERLRGFLTLKFYNLMTALTYVFMDNFCTCFRHDWNNMNDIVTTFNTAVNSKSRCFNFCIGFLYWFMASFLYCFPYSYRSSNYCNSNSCRSFTLLKALAKSNGNLFAIAF